MKQTVIINILGSPGTGKTTTAMELFVNMKKLGMDVEFVSEFAKEALYENREKVFNNELYMFAKKQHKIHTLVGEVDYVVTDAPIILSKYYNMYHNGTDEHDLLNLLIEDEFLKYNNFNILLESDVPYVDKGRHESSEMSKEIHEMIREDKFEYDMVTFDNINGDIDLLVAEILYSDFEQESDDKWWVTQSDISEAMRVLDRLAREVDDVDEDQHAVRGHIKEKVNDF